MEYFSTICYGEKQAHIVCGVHLVIFSTSFQWKSINLLFHVFRQEITVSVELYCFFFSSVGSQHCLKLWKVHTCQFIHQLRKRYVLVMLIMNVLTIAYWVSLIFNAYFTTNWLASVWEVLLNFCRLLWQGFITFYLQAVKQSQWRI